MYLDAVRENLMETAANGSAKAIKITEKKPVFETWKDWNPSQISHHGALCCEIAREWITATDFSELSGDCVFTGPRWLRKKFNWGASSFPIFWCEAVRKKTLDCGALAALAHQVFTARGVKSYRVQVVQEFTDVATAQWSNSWNPGNEPLPWINGELIYHEGCAIETADNAIKVWDPSAGWWIDPKPANGYGAMLAIRFSGFNLSPDSNLVWGRNTIRAAEWTQII